MHFSNGLPFLTHSIPMVMNERLFIKIHCLQVLIIHFGQDESGSRLRTKLKNLRVDQSLINYSPT